MKRPMLVIVIGYIIGIIWGLYLKTSIVFLYVILISIYILINIQYKKRKFKILSIKRYFRYIKIILKINIILIIIVSSFISNTIIKRANQKYENLYKNVNEIKLSGKIMSNKIEKEYINRYKIKVLDKKFKNTYIYIDVAKDIKLEYGDYIEAKGNFKEPQTERNYKGFDYKEYLKTLRIYGTVKIENIVIKEKANNMDFMKMSNNIFLKIKNNIETTYSEKTRSIMLGILLGYTNDIDEQLKEQFSKSNISHILAVSGMHISYIIYLVANSTLYLFGKRKSKIFASIILVVYMFITGLSISVIRACIMGVISCMAFIMYRKSDTLNNIAISMLIILIHNPFSLLSLSFLLSYGGTIGIILFESTVEKMLKSIKIKNRKWKYVFIKIQRKCEIIIKTLSVTISAQIIIMPIIVIKFNNLGISFLITNLLLSAVIGAIVMGGFVQILISFISLKCATAIAKLIEIPIYILVFISELGEKIPFGNFKVITPDLYQIILYYVFIFILFYLYKVFHIKHPSQTETRIKNTIHLFRYKTKPYKKIIFMITFVIAIMLLIKFPEDLRMYFIDVGQGDSTLIITPNNKTILIDGGGSNFYDVGKNTLVPYLLDRKVNKLDLVIISHFDQDHVGGILSVLKELKVEKIIIGKQGEVSEQYNEFCNIIREKGIPIFMVKRGDVINVEKNVKIKILFPENDLILDNILNNNSLVAKLEYKDFKMLFTGDIEDVAEQHLMKIYKNDELKANILKVAHHGSKTSTSEEFLKVVLPQIALIGVGENNKFGHPSSEVLNRFKELRCKSL